MVTILDLNSSAVAGARDLLASLGITDCGDPNCPVHGAVEQDPGLITAEDIEKFSSRDLQDLALGAVAAASNAFGDGEDRLAVAFQRQAQLWMQQAEIREKRELADQQEPERERSMGDMNRPFNEYAPDGGNHPVVPPADAE